MAKLVAAHATPVGSWHVSRGQSEFRSKAASAAVIAWMRHQTTAYDDMKIARVKGERRKVRRELQVVSRRVLDAHRKDAAARSRRVSAVPRHREHGEGVVAVTDSHPTRQLGKDTPVPALGLDVP